MATINTLMNNLQAAERELCRLEDLAAGASAARRAHAEAGEMFSLAVQIGSSEEAASAATSLETTREAVIKAVARFEEAGGFNGLTAVRREIGRLRATISREEARKAPLTTRPFAGLGAVLREARAH